jgi:preprotein translocase subunit SecD
VLGRRATDSTEKAREQQAMTVLRNRKYDEELQTWLRQIRDEAYVEIKLPGATRQPVKPKRFAVTPGEPAGIGPDLCLLLAAKPSRIP